ncbi:sulfur carrier protein ThiS [Snuella lapsa]|uniref:Sulfur carrier protein ThiS n=2 Tax=Snuella lapsa TaxID=870481 RepID=A0ABP6XG92_9FLAO
MTYLFLNKNHAKNETGMIKIYINDTSTEIKEDFNVMQVLEQVRLPIEGIAVAVNNAIVPRDQWDSTIFNSNDHVLIIQATQGG